MNAWSAADVARRIVIVDPLTLLGREVLQILPEYPALLSRLAFVHTGDEDEHEIAEIAGEPGLVPPLQAPDQLRGCDAVLVTSDRDRPRLEHLEAFLVEEPMLPLVDAARRPNLRSRTRPMARPKANGGGLAVRVAHPAAVAVVTLLEPLTELGIESVTLAAIEPVSRLGRDAVETLAHQAAARLSGGDVGELLDGEVLAFSLVSAPDDELAEDLAVLLGHSNVAVARTRAGVFHGHQALLGVHLTEPVSPGELTERWEMEPSIALVDGPLRLDAVVDQDRVLVAEPEISGDGRTVAVAAAVDGLRLGGARSALDILQLFL